ncbi:cupin [Thermosipho melanesiensis]|uniref:Cupin n=1 Tax=Thermosipho melanesiensis TaxID=46541 RepID=A0ABM6GDG5_9BACT|nr:cupin domain-containing protein [Thermosipho melanesiensis]APT73599.1 cupin [Thermosipho melanesiensis]OOC37546.1 cupin [Thermosipho melanesiensis]OOC39442.1 cupin [Thermosipho melanesiensis]OOC39505.1 cupin [Thermosipho melanesiensis]OOC42578.1 cupin [Thermosipho melanesiensis]
MKLGSKIRTLRVARGYTQEELADRCDLSRSFISQLENDQVSPSIDTLERILRVLGSDLKTFFSNDKRQEKIVFKVKDRVPMYLDELGIKGFILMDNIEDKSIDPKLIEMEPGAETEEEEPHEGDEFGFVISGKLELILDGKKYKVNEGDCFYYCADRKHKIRNPYKEKVKFIWIDIE